jgi:hypothetical protein
LQNIGKEKMNKKLSRRDFLKLAGVTSAGLALSACGVKATEFPTSTFVSPTETTIPTVTAAPTLTATPKPPTLRTIGEKLGVLIGTTVDGAEPYHDPKYILAANEHFSVLFDQSLAPATVKKWGIAMAKEFRQQATTNNQILYIHSGFDPLEDEQTLLENVSDTDVKKIMEERVRLLLGFVEKVDNGAKPTFINFLNEVFWYDNSSGSGGIHKSKYRTVFGNKFASEAYLMFNRISQEMGLEIGKDFRMIYSDSDIQKPRKKSELVLNELLRAKKDVASTLGKSEQDIQLDIAPHFYQSMDGKVDWYRLPPPTKDEILENFTLFSQVGRIHVTELNILGTRDQDKINSVLSDVITTAIKSGFCDSINIWYALRLKPPKGQDGDWTYNSLGLFDDNFIPTHNYQSLVQNMSTL